MYCDDSFSNEFNRFPNLDSLEWNIIMHLVNSDSIYASKLWKILKYDTEDCLLKPEVSRKDRLNLIYTNNGEASIKRVFMTPYIDDAWVEQSSHLHIYVGTIVPENNILSKVNIIVETIVHNKISNIVGDATGDYLATVNPTELDEEENPKILFKNRETVMLKSILAELNGKDVNGVGTLQFNNTLSPYSNSRQYLWNNKTFYGHQTVLATMMSGASSDSECGY